jgi:hypothetical protein
MSLLAQTSTQQLVTSSITAVTAQFQTLSTQTFNVSSINGIVPGAAFSGSTVALSTALVTTSTLATNALTTSSITSYGTVDIQGSVLSNVGTEYFIKPLYTTTFLPTNISGLKAWFDASKPASITSNGSGQVATWSNLTGLGNAVQITASNTPVTGQLSINSLNTMQFNAISQMTFGPISYSNTSRIVFAVLVTPFNPSVNGKSTFIFGGQADGSIGTAGFHAYQWSGSGFEFTTSTGGGQWAGYITYTSLVNAGTFSSSTAWLLTYHSGFGIFLNGTSNAPSSNLNTGSITDIFGTTAQGTNVNSFYIAEFLHYDTSFTATQRQTVEGYLAWKWGFQATLNGAHPYLSVPPPPLGTALLAMGGITADTGSNISFSATNKIRLTAPVEIPTTLSTAALTVSSINGQTIGQPIQSTVIGLGSMGYISTAQLTSTVRGIGSGFTGSTIGLSAATINTSTINSVYLSSVQGYVSSLRTDSLTVGGPTGYVTVQDLTTGTVSTGQLVAGAGFISSLQINTLSFGPTGYVIVGDVIANSLSTTRLNTQALYANNAYIGNVSSQSAILFPGIDGNYRGTAVAEQTTGVGTGELLLYKVSSTTDQIRLQTTGNIVFEAGAASRSWNSTTQLATPTLYIAGSTSNVGVGTATPAATLDVVGTGRFQTVSSLALNVSSINGAAPGGTFNGSTTALSTAIVTTSTLATNSAKTSSLTMYGTLNMTNNPLTNIYSALFAPSYSGNPNAAAGGLYTTYTSGAISYAVHAFKTVGTTTFTPNATITGAQILVIGGGGSGGGGASSGGGGAGGLVYVASATITPATYSIVVGGGGALASNPAYNTPGVGGSNSSALGYTGNGGGAGGSDQNYSGGSGGCGGGGCGLGGATGGTGTQGYAGGTAVSGDSGAGGGGMGSIGSVNSAGYGGAGGSGVTYSITGTATGYAAGGGGSSATGTNPAVGGSANATIIGGNGGASTVPPTAGAANTGSGGGGQRSPSGFILPGAGGSGIVIIAYPLNQYSYTPYTVGTITGDATSNLSIQPVNNLNIVGTTQTSALLVASTFSTTFINATTVSTAALQVSSINGQTFGQPINSTVIGLGTAGYVSTLTNVPLLSSMALITSSVKTNNLTSQIVIAQPSGTTSAASVSPLAVTNGNAYLSFSPQIEFQYNSGGYKHFMGSRHYGNFVGNFGNAIDFWLYSAASGGSTASTAPNTGNVNTLSVTAAGVGIFNNSPAYALDVNGVINGQTSIQTPLLSTLNINVSTINGQTFGQPINSTIIGLATAGYISSTQLGSTVTNLITRIGAGGGGGGTTFVGSTTFLSATQVLFSTQTGYNISSVLGFVSSLQVDELQIGTGFGIIAFGDTNMSSISTLGIAAGLGNFTTINVSSINGAIPGTGSGGTTFTGTLGTVSSLTALRFFGLTGTYANTAVAEVSTGTGLQELLLYKVSSVSDQVRVQTTGNVIFETGVSARSWPTASRVLPPTLYIAGSNSNVGIGTSNPVTALDVAGTGRFQTLSSLNITAGSINYSVAFV